MVEIGGDRLEFGHRIAATRRHQHDIGVDVHIAQQRKQQDRLGLAITVTLVPRIFRSLRQVIAAIQPVEQVADLVLHRLRGKRGAGFRIPGLRHDPFRNRLDLTAGCQLGGLGEMRFHHFRQVLPAVEAADAQQRVGTKTRRRIARHILTLGDRHGNVEEAVATALLHFGKVDEGSGLPAHFLGRWPADNRPALSHAPWRGGKVLDHLDLIPQRLVIDSDRVGHAQQVAFLEAGYGNRRGQPPIEQAAFKVFLAPDDIEFDALRDEVDHFAIANDLEAMDEQVSLVG